ncbi:alkaline ceramidase ydc1 [Microbotryomycetes sp. JL221]|nr:alkaline ceramidase ydc1 [Microbotryomycetes sp. JL221]
MEQGTMSSHDDANRSGYWGPVTASIDWCEANYLRSFYIAELFNTVSNSAFIALAVFGIYKSQQQNLPARFAVAYAAIALIGLGSTLFHATLLYTWQMGDELPMIYCSAGIMWIVFDLSPLDAPVNLFIPSLLAAFCVAFTSAYVLLPNPIFHQVTYAILISATFYRTMWLLWTRLKGHPVVKQARRLYIMGSIQFGGAFLIWNLDNVTCNGFLTPLKEKVGDPFNWFLEGHAWWHIFTGLGAYNVTVSLCLITLALRDSADNYEINSVLGFIPFVQRSKKGWESWKSRSRQQNVADSEREQLLQRSGEPLSN